MDIASLVGLIGACGMIIGAMLAGGSLGPFVDTASILIVIGGTFFRSHVPSDPANILRAFRCYG